MKSRLLTLFPWVAAGAAIAGLGAALYGYHERGAELQRLQSRIETNDRTARREIVGLKERLSEAISDARRNSPTQGQESVSKIPTRGKLSMEAILEKERKDPAYARLWRRNAMRTIQRLYGDALADLKLPPDKLEKMKDLLFERLEAFSDAQDAAQEAGLTNKESALAVSQSQNEIDDEITTLIGADQFAIFQQDSQVETFKSVITNGLEADMEAGGAPLTPDQVTALSRLYADAVNPSPGLFKTKATDPATGLTFRSQWLLEKASSVLSPAQLQIMKQSLFDDQEGQQYYKKLTAGQGGG